VMLAMFPNGLEVLDSRIPTVCEEQAVIGG
jgi:hypothetical protein